MDNNVNFMADECYSIVGAAMEVHKALGKGLLNMFIKMPWKWNLSSVAFLTKERNLLRCIIKVWSCNTVILPTLCVTAK